MNLDVVVASDGTVIWVAPTVLKMTCGHEFRGNEWICPMRFGSWTYDGSQVRTYTSIYQTAEYLINL